MTIDAPLDLRPAAIPTAPVNSLLTSPILPTLLKLALPNAIAMFGTALVAVAETSYIGRLGTEPLAGIALVFPFVMLTQMMSAGAMGGGVSSAISRALGAGNRDRAATLALHAAMIGTCAGLFFTVVMLTFGRQFYSLLGGRGGVLEQAMRIFARAVLRRDLDLAGQYAGLGGARHRRHAHPSAVLIVVASSRSWSAAASVLDYSACRNSACPGSPQVSSPPSRSGRYSWRGTSPAAAAG